MWGDLSIYRLVFSLDNVVDTEQLKQTSVSGEYTFKIFKN